MKRIKLLFTLALPVFLMQSAQAQTGSRLISQSHWTNNSTVWVPVDTASYHYADMVFGGDLTHTLKYDTSYWMAATDSTATRKSLQDFNSDRSIKSTSNLMLTMGIWSNLNRSNYFYNSSRTTQMIYQLGGGASGWTNFSMNAYDYTGSGKVFTDKYYTWNGTDFSNFVSQKTYMYNALDLISSETHLNASSAGPIYTEQWTYEYDTVFHSNVSTLTYLTWSGFGFEPSSRNTYTYDGVGNRTNNTYQVWDATNRIWVNTTLKTYSGFTAGHNPMNEVDKKWDTTGTGSWYNWMNYDYTYNGFEQMTSSVATSWTSTGATTGFWQHANGDPMALYHYGPTWGLSVANTNNENGTINIFPVPVQDLLSIDLNWNEAQPCTISIFDMAGRMVNNFNVASTSHYVMSVNTNNYPVGNYIVKVAGANGSITKEIVIAR